MSAQRLGLIGIGLLGRALAERFLAAGFDVIGFDRDAGALAAVQKLGGRPARSASEVAAGASRLVLCLPDHDVVRSVLDEIGSVLASGQVVIDTTTGDFQTAEELASALSTRGIAYVEATISGSSDQVRYGDALVMVGGDSSACDACRDVIAAISPRSLFAGAAGAAARLKLASNLVLGLNRAALAEGLGFAVAVGLDPALALQAFREGVAYSRIMDSKGPKLLAGDYTPQARLSQHAKDVRLMLAAAAEVEQRLPLSEVHQHLLQEAVDRGWGDLDNCALYRLYRSGGDG